MALSRRASSTDALTTPPARLNLQDRSRSRVQSILSNDPQHALKRSEYIVGICLLLVVVFLWTSSNFITQVCANFSFVLCMNTEIGAARICLRAVMRNHFCEPISAGIKTDD